MTTLIVLRTPDLPLATELAAAAAHLGEVAALDLTGEFAADALPVATVFRPTGAGDFTTAPGAAAAIAAATRAEASIDLVLIDASFAGKEIAGYAASVLDSAVVTDAANLRREGDQILADRTVLAGTWTTTCALTRGVGVIALAPGSLDQGVDLPAAGSATLVDLDVELPPAAAATEVVSRTPQDFGDGIPLEGADIVVVAGRGVEGDFTLVRELADQLGAAVGATRVATDEGWIEHTAQIGQTGVVIRPRIYLGLGVSGAIHHTVGMQNSEIIIAVNTDSEAPIFEIADFGIVGDLNDVVPQLIAALKG